MHNTGPRSEVGDVSQIGPRRVPPELAKGGLLGPVQTGRFQAESALSPKQKMFGLGFQLRRPPAKQQGPRRRRKPRPYLALWELRAR